jgi:GT2 family glycosyltransferase
LSQALPSSEKSITTSNAIDVSVVICAYTERRWDELVACVDSIRRQSYQPKEIIVVVDHNPGLLSRVCSHLPAVVAIPNQEGGGLSGARNTGVKVARGAIVAFIDEDAMAAPDWLGRLVERYDDGDVLGVGGAIIPSWQVAQPRWFPDEFLWVVGCTYRGMPMTTAPVRNLIGCNMSFRREAFAVAGGFRNGLGRLGTLPLGCEETEFCIRLRQRLPGKKLIYAPQATVKHLVPRERATQKYFLSRCRSEGRSKAIVAKLVGSDQALGNERTFVARTLTRGILSGLWQTITLRDSAGWLRAMAMIAGLVTTTFGYGKGMLTERVAASA